MTRRCSWDSAVKPCTSWMASSWRWVSVRKRLSLSLVSLASVAMRAASQRIVRNRIGATARKIVASRAFMRNSTVPMTSSSRPPETSGKIPFMARIWAEKVSKVMR